jgi:hypothetical protein
MSTPLAALIIPLMAECSLENGVMGFILLSHNDIEKLEIPHSTTAST